MGMRQHEQIWRRTSRNRAHFKKAVVQLRVVQLRPFSPLGRGSTWNELRPGGTFGGGAAGPPGLIFGAVFIFGAGFPYLETGASKKRLFMPEQAPLGGPKS
mgnify:FL=1